MHIHMKFISVRPIEIFSLYDKISLNLSKALKFVTVRFVFHRIIGIYCIYYA